MRLDPGLVVGAPKAEAAHDAGDNELGCENRVHLADKLVADIDCSLSNGATELEVIGDVVLAAARGTEDVGGAGCGLVSLVRRGRLRVGADLIRVLARRGVVFSVGCHVAVR